MKKQTIAKLQAGGNNSSQKAEEVENLQNKLKLEKQRSSKIQELQEKAAQDQADAIENQRNTIS